MVKHVYFRVLFVSVMLLVTICSTLLQSLWIQASMHVSLKQHETSLSPLEILTRARTWTTLRVPYNEGAEYNGYRTDCSGFVTMAWGLPANMPGGGLFTGNTPNNPNQPDSLSSVADLPGKALDTNGKPIPSTMTKLQPGDILLNQGAIDAHVIIFAGWVDKAAKKLVSQPVMYSDGYYYYDGIEENGGYDVGYGFAVEHTPDQPWNYPYYPDVKLDPGGYYAWRFDAQKAANLGYAPSVQPSGEWMPPSPKDGNIITNNTLHLAATAYPTHKGDPAIAIVYFTLKVHDIWSIVCSSNSPSRSGSVYTCDVDLKQFQFPVGQIQQLQVSFDVIDKEENVNLAPNGIHTLTYISRGNMAGFSQFVGTWKFYGTGMIINANGTAIYEGRTHVFCSDDPRPPCDGGDLGLDGLNTSLLFSHVDGNTAFGFITGGTGDRDFNKNILPVGSAINVTLISKGTLQISDGNGPFLSCVDYPNSVECISNT